MFTGIIERTALVRAVKEGPQSFRLELAARDCDWSFSVGDSLAVNGCCLTVVTQERAGTDLRLSFDLLRETWNRTSFHRLEPGNLVNLERSMPVNGRLHGHYVTGHIDGLGLIHAWEQRGADWALDLDIPAELRPFLARKGSIAVDGISLTVAEITQRGCLVWIIPHTRVVTNLAERTAGDWVNIETDILAKYVERLTSARGSG